MVGRYCPLCRSSMPADRCAQHDVPTVRIDHVPEPMTVGSLVDGRFRIDGVLGANVFLATELERRTQVVLKVPRSGALDREVAWARFFLEARALLAIDDPNVVSARALAVERSSERVYLLLEHLPGGTLEQRIQSGALEVSRAVRIAGDIARGLIALHARGVVHRDLKPSNIAFDAQDGAVLIDVGHAKLGETEAPPLTAPGQTLGTPAYMAPEGIAGGTLDPRADLYALGCVVFAMLCGEPPFGRGDPVEVMRRHLRQAPRDLPPAVPAELRSLVVRLLAKSKLERPESAAEVLAILETVPLHGAAAATAPVPRAVPPAQTDYTAVLPRPLDPPAGVTVTTPASEDAPPPPPRRPRASLGGVLAIAVVIALLVVVARLWFDRPTARPRAVPSPITGNATPTARPLPVAISNAPPLTAADGGVRRPQPVRAPRSTEAADAGVRPLLRIPELDP